MKTILKGQKAIDAKEANPAIILCKYQDPVEEARENISLDEAIQVAKEDPSLIYAVDGSIPKKAALEKAGCA